AAMVGMLMLGVVASTLEAIRARRAEAEQARLRQAAQAAQVQESRERQRAEAQELIARQRAYASDMAVAQQELAAENLGLVRALLDRQRPQPGQTDLRGWEWRYLWGGSRSDDEFALRGHSNEVAITMFLPDGRTAFSAGADHTLRFWDLERRCALETVPYSDNPLSAALSPEGHLLAICGSF